MLVSQWVTAGPSDYVYTPLVVQGEREIDFKMGTSNMDGAPRTSAANIGLGYGVNERWFSELYLKYKRQNNQGTHYDAVEWENKFQLTDIGEYPVDVGLIIEVERPTDHAEGWEVKWGPLFQTQLGKAQLNANLLFERSYRSESPSETELLYQWQAKYLWTRSLDFGVQGFGEVGKWDHWEPASERSHQIGPAIFGKHLLGGRKVIQYNAAWLVGTNSISPDNTFRMQVEYEF
ncbi:MAG: hypothetical protein HY272_12565 [Gammaproteobacteria bacterium]|nr:hypothetical protein [Gammaproteobacteria bacterium]